MLTMKKRNRAMGGLRDGGILHDVLCELDRHSYTQGGVR
jgi:hypothetical protein